MSTRNTRRLDYEVIVTAPRMKSQTLEVKAPNSATARREARKVWKETGTKPAASVHFSAHRKAK